jgi:hypothetical protein
MDQDDKMKPRYSFEKNKVSVASGPEDSGVLIAINPAVLKQGDDHFIRWFDPFDERRFDVKTMSVNESDFAAWKDEQGREFALEPMTLANYETLVAPMIFNAKEFEKLSELRDWFLKGIAKEVYGV